MKKNVKECKKYGAKILLQILHVGLKTHKSISETAIGPSECALLGNTTKAMSIEEIEELKLEFVKAAERASEAGFDGIELHGAHGYLLEQFLLPQVNMRTDEYGGSLENRLRFAGEIIEGIRSEVGRNFIIGYRMGCNVPEIKDGIEAATTLEKLGIDLQHASMGGLSSREHEVPDLVKARSFMSGIIPDTPDGFQYNWVVYGASEIKRYVKIPIIAVSEIRTPERAEDIIRSGIADFAAIGKDLLTDPEWANRAFERKEIRHCLRCNNCKRYIKPDVCPLFC